MHRLLWLLLPFSWAYAGVMWLRNLAYDRGWKTIWRAPQGVEVVSIGNLTVGGTGKTPVAEWLLGQRKETRQLPQTAYLSRGYGRKTRGFLRVNPAEGGIETFGDEALQVARKFPEALVAVCEDRAEGIRQLLALRPDISLVLLDDAFQHRRVHRDRNYVVIDANRPPTADFVFPAGRLREPLGGLARADVLIINKVFDLAQARALAKKLSRWQKPVWLFRTVPGPAAYPTGEKATLKMTDKVFVFSGIGNNRFFLQQMQEAGYTVAGHRFFRDHYPYSQGDIAALYELARTCGATALLTTEKDMCRLRDLKLVGELPILMIPATLEPISAD